MQFETEAEGSRLRTDVLKSGSVSPVALTSQDRASIRFVLSGQEEFFAFHRAVSFFGPVLSLNFLRDVHLTPCVEKMWPSAKSHISFKAKFS